jgi:hypothetical protein
MIEEMVVCKWNQMRIWAMNAVGISGEIAAQREGARNARSSSALPRLPGRRGNAIRARGHKIEFFQRSQEVGQSLPPVHNAIAKPSVSVRGYFFFVL